MTFDEARREYIEGLIDQAEVRVLTKLEVAMITESQIIDTFSTETLPELRMMVNDLPDGVDKENARLFVQVGEEMVNSLVSELAHMMSGHRRVTRTVQ